MGKTDQTELDSVFIDKPQIKPCSYIIGTCGHQWAPKVALVNCAGCNSFVLAAKMENCPFCNEPAKELSLRSDHIPRGGGVTKRCFGEMPYGETMDIVLERHHWSDAQASDVKFEDKKD